MSKMIAEVIVKTKSFSLPIRKIFLNFSVELTSLVKSYTHFDCSLSKLSFMKWKFDGVSG